MLGEEFEVFLEEDNESIGHLVQFVLEAVSIYVAVTSPNGIVHEEQVRELIPRPIVVAECVVFVDPIRPNLHESAIHGTAPGTAIQPYHCAMLICEMAVFEVPEEQITVMLGQDFYQADR